jgi:histidinol phosphatase-like enzyme
MKFDLETIEHEEKNTIAIDFDGVIHKNSKGFYDGTIYDELIDGSYESLESLSKKYKIIIYTCKANPNRPLVNGKTGVELVDGWLEKNGMNKFVDKVVWGKPNAKFYIDDKAVKFTTWNKVMEEINEQ